MKRSFGSTTQGRGATYAWDGNQEIGQGSMEITESTPSSRIAMKLDFVEPFEAHNQVEFTLVPNGDSTTVTWVLFGPSPFLSKLMGLFFDMDRMVGSDFEVGLASLKSAAES